MSVGKLYIAAAGSGKTSLLIEHVISEFSNLPTGKSIGIVTYTVNNQENIKERLVKHYKSIPQQIKIMGWYEYLMNYWIKPFKGDIVQELYTHHVGLIKVDGTSGL